MGLFNPNYDKPGAGVRKDEPKKKGAALYWELFSRKWRSYLLLNLIYCASCIPAFIYYFFVTVGLMPGENPSQDLSVAGMIAAFMIIFFAGSPFKSGFTYVLRNFVRQQHAWTVADFFEKTRENFGQSISAFVIDLVASTAFLFAIRFYSAAADQSKWIALLLGIVIVVMVMYAIMQSFTWCMMVTFKLKISSIYKNAFLLSMATIPVNVISIVIRVFATGLLFFSSYLSYIIIAAVFLSAAGLLEQMLAYPAIEKFMLKKPEEEPQADETSVEEEND